MGNVCADTEEEKRREQWLRGYGRFKLRGNLEGYDMKSDKKTEIFSQENYGKDILNPYKNSSYSNNKIPEAIRKPFRELTNLDYGPLSPKKTPIYGTGDDEKSIEYTPETIPISPEKPVKKLTIKKE